jgi:hypothetical protein
MLTSQVSPIIKVSQPRLTRTQLWDWYNFYVPTPFYHLSISIDLIEHPQLDTSVRETLVLNRCAFLFGNTAPDVQVISGQSREDTHFFSLPIRNGYRQPWVRLLETYPQISNNHHLQPEHAAFIAGYLCHLQADWYWVKEIYAPYFGPTNHWGTHSERIYLHNVLRAYLDNQVIKTLTPGPDNCLQQVYPFQWLPFAQDKHLREWSSFLAQQLHPEGIVQTVEVFAKRQGLLPEEFYALLNSEPRMEKEVFIHFPRELLSKYRRELLETSISMANNYLALTSFSSSH